MRNSELKRIEGERLPVFAQEAAPRQARIKESACSGLRFEVGGKKKVDLVD